MDIEAHTFLYLERAGYLVRRRFEGDTGRGKQSFCELYPKGDLVTGTARRSVGNERGLENGYETVWHNGGWR